MSEEENVQTRELATVTALPPPFRVLPEMILRQAVGVADQIDFIWGFMKLKNGQGHIIRSSMSPADNALVLQAALRENAAPPRGSHDGPPA